MTTELWILVAAIALGFIQLIASGHASLNQRGKEYAAGNRDLPPIVLTGKGGRVDRAFKNFLETFPFFAAAVLVIQVANCHNSSTLYGGELYLACRIAYVPAYISGTPYIRSIVWFGSIIGIVMVLVAPAICSQ